MYLLQKNNIHENPEKPLGNKGKDLEIMQLTTNSQNKVLLIDWYPQKTKSDNTKDRQSKVFRLRRKTAYANT